MPDRVDLEAIRRRNEERKHHGECMGWSPRRQDVFTEADCDCDQNGVRADIDTLLAEVERMRAVHGCEYVERGKGPCAVCDPQ
jgi:hypothetical protein